MLMDSRKILINVTNPSNELLDNQDFFDDLNNMFDSLKETLGLKLIDIKRKHKIERLAFSLTEERP